MSVQTDILVCYPLAGGGQQGLFTTFDAGLLFSSLRLDADGCLREVHSEIGEPGFETAAVTPFAWSGVMSVTFQGDPDRPVHSILFLDGIIQASRPGAGAFDSRQSIRSGASVPIFFFPALWGDRQERHAQWPPASLRATGLSPAPSGRCWVVAPSGDLHSLRATALADTESWLNLWNRHDLDGAVPLHGWIGLTDPDGVIHAQAARFVEGSLQWVVPVLADGTAEVPDTMAAASPGQAGSTDTRHTCLASACRILPTDYVTYGGDVVRWADDDKTYGDCSSGCRWWNPLHDEERGGADGDWGVCLNRRSRRCGMLTWEHQAGFGCFEGGAPVPGNTVARQDIVVHLALEPGAADLLAPDA